ncbi:hypothetical protein ACFQ2B_00975 [Streptomyces stramineus]
MSHAPDDSTSTWPPSTSASRARPELMVRRYAAATQASSVIALSAI